MLIVQILIKSKLLLIVSLIFFYSYTIPIFKVMEIDKNSTNIHNPVNTHINGAVDNGNITSLNIKLSKTTGFII